MAAYVGGAIRIGDYRAGLLSAGFEHVEIVDSGAELNGTRRWRINPAAAIKRWMEMRVAFLLQMIRHCTLHFLTLLGKYGMNSVAASVKVYVIKPKDGINDHVCHALL